ncbi:MAG: DUF4349 domain-containing protein [Chitinophagales bacterium]
MKFIIYILIACSVLMFSACGSTDPKWTASPMNTLYDKMASSQGADINNRMIIYNASVDLTVKNEIDSASNDIISIAKKYEGYVTETDNRKSVIKVRSEHLNSALRDISQLGKTEHQTITGSDISDQYTDFAIRLENAKEARNRYLELLARAENVSAALLVEKELERLNGEIDLLEGKIRNLDNMVTYSTITVYLNEKTKLGILGLAGFGLYEGVKWLFVR